MYKKYFNVHNKNYKAMNEIIKIKINTRNYQLKESQYNGLKLNKKIF